MNFSIPCPQVQWDEYRLQVPTESIALGCRSSLGRPIISISGAGIGGSTGHVVLEAPPLPREFHEHKFPKAGVLCLVGGLSPNAVAQIAESVCAWEPEDPQEVLECAVSLSRRARQLPWRTFFTFPLAFQKTIPAATLVPASSPTIVFVFSGQGPQHLEMGRQLFSEHPLFRKTVLELDDVYRNVTGSSLLASTGLFVDNSQADPPMNLLPTGWPVTVTVSAIAMLQIAIFDLLGSIGVRPDLLTGHSAGETAALYASGAGSKAMAMEIAIARGEAMTITENVNVGMASFACNADRASKFIAQVTADHGGVLEISCLNAPDAVAVSGSAALLDIMVALAKSDGVFGQRIRTMVPGHSSYMECIKQDYMTRMDHIFARYPGPHRPVIPVFSTCTGLVLVEEFTPDYFWQNCRNSVLFDNAISSILASSLLVPVFVEISPHHVLSTSILAHGVPQDHVLCPMRRPSSVELRADSYMEGVAVTEMLAKLSILGCNALDLSNFYGVTPRPLSLIHHKLNPRVHPAPKPRPLAHSKPIPTSGPLSSPTLNINSDTHSVLAQHIINGEPVLPATAFLELVRAL